jgi:hypothetical protein
LSGIPLGLGAGFKINDKERHRKDKDKLKDRDRERADDEDKDERERYRDGLRELQQRLLKEQEEECNHHTQASTGWTAVLESWFCHGEPLPLEPGVKPVVRRKDTPPPEILERAFSTGDIRRRPAAPATQGFFVPSRERRGPYEMLVKERMMGLYLIVFVHRDARHLVQGTSRSAVTAGLIGGRVGNKGGVGISLRMADSTFLFLNAHLAAHEGRLPNRLANMAKIKAELTVDDFLRPDDPRTVSEDVTDRFDYTFLCGDLNFRLDISRLHADWLIARQEYAQALAFDQLYNIMRNGQAFVGFAEAPINFPPTFKYDVLRTLRHRRKRSDPSKRGSPPPVSILEAPPTPALTGRPRSRSADRRNTSDPGTPQQEAKKRSRSASPSKKPERERDQSAEPSSDEDGEDGDGISLVSSGTTLSKKTGGYAEGEPDDSDDSESPVLVSPIVAGAKPALAKTKGLVRHISVKAARTAKQKWSELLTPSVVGIALARPASRTPPRTPGTPGSASKSMSFSDAMTTSHEALVGTPGLRATSTRSGHLSAFEGDDRVDARTDKGVYDSSAKQRVPSWCDRILFKSTVRPEPDPDELPHIPRTAVGTFIANAWRSLSRSRRNSAVSFAGSGPGFATATAADGPFASPSSSRPGSPPAPLVSPAPAGPGRRRRPRPVSVDISAPVPAPRRSLPRSQSHTMLSEHVQPAWPAPPSPSLPPAPRTAPAGRALTAPVPLSPISPISPMSSIHLPAAPPPLPHAASSPPGTSTPRGSTDGVAPSRWRLPFLPFLTHRDGSGSGSGSAEPGPEPFPLSPSRRRRGDVVCFEYRTLDDRGMRRLEGRSDHRPVIGSYAVYL